MVVESLGAHFLTAPDRSLSIAFVLVNALNIVASVLLWSPALRPADPK